MGDVVPLFPEGQPVGEMPNRDFHNIEMEGPPLPGTCEGVMHIFDTVPGHCRCGTEYWRPDGVLDPPGDVIGIHHVA